MKLGEINKEDKKGFLDNKKTDLRNGRIALCLIGKANGYTQNQLYIE